MKDDNKGNIMDVQHHLHLHFINSDFTWIVFFNTPVKVSCTSTNKETEPTLQDFQLLIHTNDDESSDDTDHNKLVVRVAMLNPCTTGHSTMMAHCTDKITEKDLEHYEKLLIQNAHIVPKNPSIEFEYNNNDDDEHPHNTAAINIDWDATSVKKKKKTTAHENNNKE